VNDVCFYKAYAKSISASYKKMKLFIGTAAYVDIPLHMQIKVVVEFRARSGNQDRVGALRRGELNEKNTDHFCF
jgi:hypothetical protein